MTIKERTGWRKIIESIVDAVEDYRPVTERTARNRAHRAAVLGQEAGLRMGLTTIQEELNSTMAKRLR